MLCYVVLWFVVLCCVVVLCCDLLALLYLMTIWCSFEASERAVHHAPVELISDPGKHWVIVPSVVSRLYSPVTSLKSASFLCACGFSCRVNLTVWFGLVGNSTLSLIVRVLLLWSCLFLVLWHSFVLVFLCALFLLSVYVVCTERMCLDLSTGLLHETSWTNSLQRWFKIDKTKQMKPGWDGACIMSWLAS